MLTVGLWLYCFLCCQESERDTARDVPVIEIQTIEKTDQRIEVEIASCILIQTSWYGNIFVEADNGTDEIFGNVGVMLPLAGEMLLLLYFVSLVISLKICKGAIFKCSVL